MTLGPFEIWQAAQIVCALAAAWWIVDGYSLIVAPLITRYYDLLDWSSERRMWIRATRRWVGTFSGELAGSEKGTALAILRHYLSTRPRCNSDEWRAFQSHLQQRADFASNRWRDGKPPIKPEPLLPPWMRTYSGASFWREA